MPHLLPKNDLLLLINEGAIKNAKTENCEGIKYDFRLSSRILKAKYKTPIDINELTAVEKAALFVDPGEVVFVLSEEILDLPNDIYVVLVPKRKLSHDGVMILGGLSVDPLYKGRLLIGIYNFSSSPFPLQNGKKLIGSHFFKLNHDEIDNTKKAPEAAIDDFPEDLIRLMGKYIPISSLGIMDKINTVERKLEEFKKEFRERDDWFERFQQAIDNQKVQIDNVIKTLQTEVDERREDKHGLEIKIHETFEKSNSLLNKYTYRVIWVSAIIATILSVLLSGAYWFLRHYVIAPK
jgi:deoxycytidine triphosphate deaminase